MTRKRRSSGKTERYSLQREIAKCLRVKPKTAKERVLARYPGAHIFEGRKSFRSPRYDTFAVYVPRRGRLIMLGAASRPSDAWRSAARRLRGRPARPSRSKDKTHLGPEWAS